VVEDTIVDVVGERANGRVSRVSSSSLCCFCGCGLAVVYRYECVVSEELFYAGCLGVQIWSMVVSQWAD
jgi:hypothetical protein